MTNVFTRLLKEHDTRKAGEATLAILEALVLKNRSGRIAARAGWTIDLVFLEGDSLPVRERAWQVFELFCEVVRPEPLVYWHGGRPALLTSAVSQKKLAEQRQRSVADPKTQAMMFDMASGNPKPPEEWENNAQDFRFECWISNDNGLWQTDRYSQPGIGPAMSYIRIALPVSWIRRQPLERNAGWLSTRMVELMQPLWATAGWGIMPAVEERQISASSGGREALYPYLQRFPGLNAIGGLTLQRHGFNHSMASVNWLSFVSDPLLDRLGGREAVRAQAQASPLLGVADVGNCLAVRAGAFPVLGDTQRGVPLPAFGVAARLFKDIRTRDFYNNFIGSPDSGGGADKALHQLECDAYLRRFDLY